MVKTILTIMVWASILSAQDSNGILRFNGVGGFDVNKSQAEREKNCKASIENQVNLNFNTTYKVMGKINSLRLSSLPANKGNAKISTIGEISYDETAEILASHLHRVPYFPDVTWERKKINIPAIALLFFTKKI